MEIKVTAYDLENRYRDRIEELVQCAEEEGIRMNQSSLNDIRSFIPTLVQAGRLNIFLLENGNFRVIQKDAVDDQVGLEFLGGDEIKMTIIRRDPRSRRLIANSRTMGSSSIPENFLGRQFLI